MECSAISGRVIASSFSLACFAAACLLGAAAGNSIETIIIRAGWAMVLCYVVGLAVGALIQRTVDAHVADFKLRHPLPQEEAASPSEHGDTAAPASGADVPSGVQTPGV